MSENKKVKYSQELLAQQRQDDLNLLTSIERQTQGVLGQIQFIAEIITTHKEVAPVENVNEKIRAAYEKIKNLLDPKQEANHGAELEADQRSGVAINLEKNPLVEDLGGMPLEVISPEWQQVVEGQVLDKTELANLVNKKLKSRLDLANKLRARNQPKHQAKPKQAITPKFKDIQKTVKYIIKEIPPAPQPQPRIEPPPRPRPGGM